MANPVNRVPQGLVNLLDLAGRAQAPRLLSDELRATIDVERLFLEGRRQSRTSNSSAVGSLGSWSLNLPVPQGELWWVHSFTIRTAALAAGTTYVVQPAFRPGASGTEAQGLGGVPITVTAGQAVFLSAVNVPFIVPPSGDLLVYATGITLGTAAPFVGTVDYTPLAI